MSFRQFDVRPPTVLNHRIITQRGVTCLLLIYLSIDLSSDLPLLNRVLHWNYEILYFDTCTCNIYKNLLKSLFDLLLVCCISSLILIFGSICFGSTCKVKGFYILAQSGSCWVEIPSLPSITHFMSVLFQFLSVTRCLCRPAVLAWVNRVREEEEKGGWD